MPFCVRPCLFLSPPRFLTLSPTLFLNPSFGKWLDVIRVLQEWVLKPGNELAHYGVRFQWVFWLAAWNKVCGQGHRKLGGDGRDISRAIILIRNLVCQCLVSVQRCDKRPLLVIDTKWKNYVRPLIMPHVDLIHRPPTVATGLFFQPKYLTYELSRAAMINRVIKC